MNVIDLDLPDFSNHPPPPRLTLEQYEKWIFEMLASGMRPERTPEEEEAEWLRNEGSQKEPWPDFGARADDS